ncbi:hypothetical protein ACF09J_17045 [Streptomyces sp. NPDC014889]
MRAILLDDCPENSQAKPINPKFKRAPAVVNNANIGTDDTYAKPPF